MKETTVAIEFNSSDHEGNHLRSGEVFLPLRDIFAAFAMMRVRSEFATKGLDMRSQAKHCYAFADAMIEERKGKV